MSRSIAFERMKNWRFVSRCLVEVKILRGHAWAVEICTLHWILKWVETKVWIQTNSKQQHPINCKNKTKQNISKTLLVLSRRGKKTRKFRATSTCSAFLCQTFLCSSPSRWLPGKRSARISQQLQLNIFHPLSRIFMKMPHFPEALQDQVQASTNPWIRMPSCVVRTRWGVEIYKHVTRKTWIVRSSLFVENLQSFQKLPFFSTELERIHPVIWEMITRLGLNPSSYSEKLFPPLVSGDIYIYILIIIIINIFIYIYIYIYI